MVHCGINRPMDFFMHYEHAINWIVSLCPQPDKFAHTYAGLSIWILAALVTRRPLSALLPLVPVIGLELANEVMDRVAHGSWHWHDTVRDMAATWFWPIVLFVCLRLLPGLSEEKHKSTQSAQHDVESAMPAMPTMRAPDSDNITGVLTDREPV